MVIQLVWVFLILAAQTDGSFIIEVDLTEELLNIQDTDYFRDDLNDRPIIGDRQGTISL